MLNNNGNNGNNVKNSKNSKSGKNKKTIINGVEMVWNPVFQAWGIWRPYRRDPKTGELIWAKLHGKKAWFIPLYYGPVGDADNTDG